MGTQQTSKKVKIIGTQTYINANTGEIIDMEVSQIEERDFNFSKVWMRNFIAALDIVGNKKTKLCYWIVENINKENMLIGTLRDIAKRTNTSLETVRITMDILLDADFLRRKSQGVYIVNPDIIFKGGRGNRLNVLNQYNASPKVELSDELKLKNLLNTIKELTAEVEKLQKRLEEKDLNDPNQLNCLDLEPKKQQNEELEKCVNA